MSMGPRIKALRKSLDLTQQKFADRIGVQRNTIAMYEMGKTSPSEAVILSICREFDVNEMWLRDGTGEMFIERTRDEEIAAYVGKVLENPDDSFSKRLISTLSKLSEEQLEVLAEVVEKIAKDDIEN